MKMARIEIHQQLAQLQIETQLGQLKIDSSVRRGMKVQQSTKQVDAQTVQPELQVDLSAYRYSAGMKNISDFTQDLASRASQIASQTTESIAQDGNYVGTLPQHGNAMSQVAGDHMLNDSVSPFQTYSDVPGKMVDVTVNQGSVDVNYQGGNFQIVWDDVVRPSFEWDPPPSVDVYLARKPNIEFQVVEMEIPPELPGEIDATA